MSESIAALERVRKEARNILIEAITKVVMEHGEDFHEHYDYYRDDFGIDEEETEENTKVLKIVDMYNHGGAVVRWTVSKEMQDANFKDSFREINPDPVRNIGTTWLTDADSLETVNRYDRIDYIYYTGKTIKAVESQCYDHVLGEPFTFKGEDFFYPSDHGFVLTTFVVKK